MPSPKTVHLMGICKGGEARKLTRFTRPLPARVTNKNRDPFRRNSLDCTKPNQTKPTTNKNRRKAAMKTETSRAARGRLDQLRHQEKTLPTCGAPCRLCSVLQVLSFPDLPPILEPSLVMQLSVSHVRSCKRPLTHTPESKPLVHQIGLW